MVCPQGIKYNISIRRQFIKPVLETGNKRDKISLNFLYSVTIVYKCSSRSRTSAKSVVGLIS